MNLIALLIISILISFLLIYIFFQFMYIDRKRKMHKKETELIDSGNGPSGSGLCHGMILNENKNGVVSVSKKSTAWYIRLV